MIWHLLEVWLMIVLAFVVGCLAGAHLYGLISESRLAPVQGVFADFIGDALDGIKARVGLAPAWRPDHFRRVERAIRQEPPILPTGPEAQEEADAESTATAPDVDLNPVLPRLTRRPLRRTTIVEPASDVALAEEEIGTSELSAARPAGLAAPRGGVPDNLQRIKGIGKRNEELLNGLGIFHFGQIAAWTPGEAQWIGQYLSFPERITRDDWVGQAMLLAMGSQTGFQKSAERRRERRRREREFQVRLTTAGAGYEGASGHPDELGLVEETDGRHDNLDTASDAEDAEYPDETETSR